MQSIIDRRALAAKYRDNYGIRIDPAEIEKLTEKQLLIKLETRWQIIKETTAVVRIQSMARRLICMNLYDRL